MGIKKLLKKFICTLLEHCTVKRETTNRCYKVIDPIIEINKTEKLSLIQRSQGLKPMFNLHENSRQQLYTVKKFKFSEIQIGKKHKKPTIMHHTGN